MEDAGPLSDTYILGRADVRTRDADEVQLLSITDPISVRARGELVLVMGGSGSGKSTLFKAMQGICDNNLDATVQILRGERHATRKDLRQIYLVPQDEKLFGTDRVVEILNNYRRVYAPMSPPDSVHDLLRALHMTKCEQTQIVRDGVSQLSGGQRKRLAAGSVLLCDTWITMLDEPISGLDDETAINLCTILKEISLLKSSVVMTIHQPSDQILELATHVILLKEGRIYESGPIDSVRSRLTTQKPIQCDENGVQMSFSQYLFKEHLSATNGHSDNVEHTDNLQKDIKRVMDLLAIPPARKGGLSGSALQSIAKTSMGRKITILYNEYVRRIRFTLRTVNETCLSFGKLFLIVAVFGTLYNDMGDTLFDVYAKRMMIVMAINGQDLFIIEKLVYMHSAITVFYDERAKRMTSSLSWLVSYLVSDALAQVPMVFCYSMALLTICSVHHDSGTLVVMSLTNCLLTVYLSLINIFLAFVVRQQPIYFGTRYLFCLLFSATNGFFRQIPEMAWPLRLFSYVNPTSYVYYSLASIADLDFDLKSNFVMDANVVLVLAGFIAILFLATWFVISFDIGFGHESRYARLEERDRGFWSCWSSCIRPSRKKYSSLDVELEKTYSNPGDAGSITLFSEGQ